MIFLSLSFSSGKHLRITNCIHMAKGAVVFSLLTSHFSLPLHLKYKGLMIWSHWLGWHIHTSHSMNKWFFRNSSAEISFKGLSGYFCGNILQESGGERGDSGKGRIRGRGWSISNHEGRGCWKCRKKEKMHGGYFFFRMIWAGEIGLIWAMPKWAAQFANPAGNLAQSCWITETGPK